MKSELSMYSIGPQGLVFTNHPHIVLTGIWQLNNGYMCFY